MYIKRGKSCNAVTDIKTANNERVLVEKKKTANAIRRNCLKL